MKLLASFLLLSVTALAQKSQESIIGTWLGFSTVHSHQVPIALEISGTGPTLKAALLNGSERAPTSAAAIHGNHLVLTFNYYARTLDATLTDGVLSGTFGTATVRYPVKLTLGVQNSISAPNAPDVHGDWEIAVRSAKGESAWQLSVEQRNKSRGREIRAVIQRIDGDTGSLYGGWNLTAAQAGEPVSPNSFRVSHFTAAGPALYSFSPQPDGTLLVSNLLRADGPKPDQQNLVARRPDEARKQNLAPPTDSAQQTTVKDPNVPFAFSFPDLTGKTVANTDPQFDGKVVIVAIGGSWCPNCHDEAPFLVSLYQQFHSRGLEIVNLSFEEADQLKDPTRLRAFIARYSIPYTVLLGGETEQLNEKIPQGVNLNSWPTSFFLGRDGRVKEVHAGFAGPANPPANKALIQEVTALVERLLAEPAPTRSALLKQPG